MTFTKLDRGILQSSILSEPSDIFKTFVILLAGCDADGISRVSPAFIAHAGNMPSEIVHEALAKLEAPDPDSRTTDEEGRRIRRVNGGYFIINYQHYREPGYSTSEAATTKREWRARKAGEGESASGQCPDKKDNVRTKRTMSGHSSSTSSSPSSSSSGGVERGEAAEIVEKWNAFAQARGLPVVRSMPAGSARERALLARLKDPTWDFEKILEAVAHQPFLLGDNPQGFMADFEFILKPSRYPKILEGSYRDGICGRARDRQPEDPYVGARKD